MIEKLAKRFVVLQSEVGIIQDNDADVYQYGYVLMIEVALNLVLSFILGALLGQIKEVIFFLCMFIPLRSFCGGYHAKKAWHCAILSNLFIIGIPILSQWLVQYSIPVLICLVGESILGICIACFSPVQNENKELDAIEQNLYKKSAIKVLAIEMFIGFFLLWGGKQKMFNVLLFVHILQVVSLLVAYVK